MQAILDKVRAFVKEISNGGPAAKADGNAPVQSKLPSASIKAVNLSTSLPKKQKAAIEEKAKNRAEGKRKFETKEKFYARAGDIYACFTDSKRASAFTQSPSKVRHSHLSPHKAQQWMPVPKFGCPTQQYHENEMVLDKGFIKYR